MRLHDRPFPRFPVLPPEETSMPDLPSPPVTSLSVRPWPDLVIDQVGHDPRSPYVERFWLGLLGPTATWLLRRLARGLEDSPAGFELDLEVTAREIGVGNRSGQSSPFLRAVQRLCRFAAADLVDDTTLRVRRKLPPLTQPQLARLPRPLRDAHGVWTADPTHGTSVQLERRRNRARHLALSLLELGEDGEATERQLHRWRVHPAIAHEATAWAVARHRQASSPQPPSAGDPPEAA